MNHGGNISDTFHLYRGCSDLSFLPDFSSVDASVTAFLRGASIDPESDSSWFSLVKFQQIVSN